MPQSRRMTGEGAIREVFTITGRGLVLVVEDGFRGTVQRGGTVESRFGSAPIHGLEFRDSIAEKKSWVAVIVDAAVGHFFPPGEAVRFHADD